MLSEPVKTSRLSYLGHKTDGHEPPLVCCSHMSEGEQQADAAPAHTTEKAGLLVNLDPPPPHSFKSLHVVTSVPQGAPSALEPTCQM